MGLRIHCVAGDDRDNLVVALCGRKLVSQATYMLAMMAGSTWLQDNRHKLRVYAHNERAFYTVEEYIDGEKGCEDINCKGCRARMDEAIQRSFE